MERGQRAATEEKYPGPDSNRYSLKRPGDFKSVATAAKAAFLGHSRNWVVIRAVRLKIPARLAPRGPLCYASKVDGLDIGSIVRESNGNRKTIE